jgi:hypothetical protein
VDTGPEILQKTRHTTIINSYCPLIHDKICILDGKAMKYTLGNKAIEVPVSKEVNIEIADSDFEGLNKNGYWLCFAKIVGNEDYNVVWSSYTDQHYFTLDQFAWEPKYRIFGTNTFQSGVTVTACTKQVDIELGQEIVIDERGRLGDPEPGESSTSITLVNEFGYFRPGLSQLSVGVDGIEKINPIYVAKNQIAKGTVNLTPVEKVLIWFEQNIETSTMFSDARTQSSEVDLTNSNLVNKLYSKGNWS